MERTVRLRWTQWVPGILAAVVGCAFVWGFSGHGNYPTGGERGDGGAVVDAGAIVPAGREDEGATKSRKWSRSASPDYIAGALAGKVDEGTLEDVRQRLLREESDELVFAGLAELSRAFDPRLRMAAAIHLTWGYRIAAEKKYPVEDALRGLWGDREVRIRRFVVLNLISYDSPIGREALLAGACDNDTDLFAGPGNLTIGQECRRAMRSQIGVEYEAVVGMPPSDRTRWVHSKGEVAPSLVERRVRLGESVDVDLPAVGTGYRARVTFRGLGTCPSSYGAVIHDAVDFLAEVFTPSGNLMASFGSEQLPALAPIRHESNSIQAVVHWRVLDDSTAKFWITACRLDR